MRSAEADEPILWVILSKPMGLGKDLVLINS